jgi:UDP-3-O-[3-hydroxymyristoyl] glucosamine N-acyltransferase
VFGRGALDNFRMTGKAKIENEIEMNMCGTRIAILDEALIKNVRNIIGKDIFIQDHAVLEEQSSIHGNYVTIKDSAYITNGVNIEDNVTVSECVKLYATPHHMDGTANAIFTGDRDIDVRYL